MKLCVIVVIAFISAVVAQARDVAWGASSNGLSLGITFASDGNALELHFRNDTTDVLMIATGHLWWHCDLCLDGKRIMREDDTKDLMLSPPTAKSFTRIPAGAIYTESVALSRWRALSPGVVSLTYYNIETDGKAFGLNVWKGTVQSGTHEIKAANQALQTTPMTRSVYEKTIEFGDPPRGV